MLLLQAKCYLKQFREVIAYNSNLSLKLYAACLETFTIHFPQMKQRT